jgi:hypothetical protein
MSFSLDSDPRSSDVKLIAFDGPPGTGKTRKIVALASEWGGLSTAVVTYTKDAAAIVKQRAPDVLSGTVYSLTWPYVKHFMSGKVGTSRILRSYSKRKIHHLFDPALDQYVSDAPSARPPHRLDEVAKRVHGWSGGEAPVKLNEQSAEAQLRFVLPMAKWLEAGAPIPEDERFDRLLIDESQDMSWLELRAALALVRSGGEVWAFGDPGQAIFGNAKGMAGSSLPPVWQRANETSIVEGGYRVGDPVASVAAGVLRSWYDRPASTFRAEHTTTLSVWDASVQPATGLVLGYSRNNVSKAFRTWGLRETGISPKVADADKELVLSTGHSAKGAESNSVYILPWSRVAIERLEQKDPATLRLLYVMLTRARKHLYLPRQLRARIL